MPRTLELGPEASGLTIAAYPGESPILSGGRRLQATWTKTSRPGNQYVADVGDQVAEVPGLQLGRRSEYVRATRARYPNLPSGIEASCGYGCMIPGKAAAWSAPRNDFGPVQYYTDRTPAHRRNLGFYALQVRKECLRTCQRYTNLLRMLSNCFTNS